MMTQYPLTLDSGVLLQIAKPLAAFLIALLVLLLARHFLLKWLYRRAPHLMSLASVALETLRVPSVLWCLAAALHIALQLSEVPERYTVPAGRFILVFLVLSLSMVVASVSVRMLTLYGQHRSIAFAASGLARALINIFVFTIGGMVLLWMFDKKITPLLTALGVGGLAVALALQDTLANFFAGIHILLEEPIRVGHLIRITENEEGVVYDIGWRTTRLRNGRHSIVVIPNTKITSGILTNYSLPEARVGVDLPVMAAWDADPDQVVKIALEEVFRTPGVLPDPAPKVFFNPGFLPTHLQFTLAFSVADFTQQGPVTSDARLRLLRRMRAEGVPLPRVEIR